MEETFKRVQKHTTAKSKDKLDIQKVDRYKKESSTSNDKRDSENQAVSNSDGEFERKRHDEKSSSIKGNSRAKVL